MKIKFKNSKIKEGLLFGFLLVEWLFVGLLDCWIVGLLDCWIVVWLYG